MALIWAAVLTLIIFWTATTVWRKVSQHKSISIGLTIFLLYASLAPLWSLADNIRSIQTRPLTFSILNAGPASLTAKLPWPVWPMTVILAVVIPLAFFFALWDQFSAFKKPGGRHGGNFFLALAFLGILPYGFLNYDQAREANPDLVDLLRNLSSKIAVLTPTTTEILSVSVTTPAKTEKVSELKPEEPVFNLTPLAIAPLLPEIPPEEATPKPEELELKINQNENLEQQLKDLQKRLEKAEKQTEEFNQRLLILEQQQQWENPKLDNKLEKDQPGPEPIYPSGSAT